MKKIMIAIALSVASVGFAEEGKVGDGGLDLLLPNGQRVPMEQYLANMIKPVGSVCNFFESKYNPVLKEVESKKWKEAINQLVWRVYEKNLQAGLLLMDAFDRVNFKFLVLNAQQKITPTNDAGVLKFIEGLTEQNQVNGAIRIGKYSYVDTNAWRSYWEARDTAFPFGLMLQRVLHEALLERYGDPESKLALSQLVVEVLRFARLLEDSPHDELRVATPREFRDYFRVHGFGLWLEYDIDVNDNLYIGRTYGANGFDMGGYSVKRSSLGSIEAVITKEIQDENGNLLVDLLPEEFKKLYLEYLSWKKNNEQVTPEKIRLLEEEVNSVRLVGESLKDLKDFDSYALRSGVYYGIELRNIEYKDKKYALKITKYSTGWDDPINLWSNTARAKDYCNLQGE